MLLRAPFALNFFHLINVLIKSRLLLQTLILINYIAYFDQLPPLNMNLCRTPYLEPSRTSTMEFICENIKRQLNIPIIDWVLNTSLSYIVYSTLLEVTPYSRLLFWIPLTVCPGGKYSECQTISPKKYEEGHINSFQDNDTFLYLLRTSENLFDFWHFQGCIEMEHWPKMDCIVFIIKRKSICKTNNTCSFCWKLSGRHVEGLKWEHLILCFKCTHN